MIGIYVVENMINHKKYVGQSKNIEIRWQDHKYHRGKGLLSQAIKTVGVQNFKFSVIEECEAEWLDILEKYYIKKLNTIYPNGYNKAEGGKIKTPSGEKNPKSILTEQDVYSIREDYKNHVNINDAYSKYSGKITIHGFKSVWNGNSWKSIHMDVYTPENREWHRINFDRITNHSRVVSDDDIRKIRDIRNTTSLPRAEILKMFPKININTFNDIWYDRTFKHIKSTYPNMRSKHIKPSGFQDGSNNPGAKFSAKDVKEIRQRKHEGHKMSDVYQDYKNICCKEAFKNLWEGRTYKNES